MADAGLPLLHRPDDLYHIKPEKGRSLAELPEVADGGARKTVTLAALNCVERPTEILVAARLDLDKHQHLAGAGNKIKLVAANPHAPPQDAPAVPAQILFGLLLTPQARTQMLRQ